MNELFQELFHVPPHITEVTEESVVVFVDCKSTLLFKFVWDTKLCTITYKCTLGQNYITLKHPEDTFGVERITLIVVDTSVSKKPKDILKKDEEYLRLKFTVTLPDNYNSLSVVSGKHEKYISSILDNSNIVVHLSRSCPTSIRSMRKSYSKINNFNPSTIYCFAPKKELDGITQLYHSRLYSNTNNITLNGKLCAQVYYLCDSVVLVCQNTLLLVDLIEHTKNFKVDEVTIVINKPLIRKPRIRHRLLLCNSTGSDRDSLSKIYTSIFDMNEIYGKRINLVCGGTCFGCKLRVCKSSKESFSIVFCGNNDRRFMPGDYLFSSWIKEHTVKPYEVFMEESCGETILSKSTITKVENNFEDQITSESRVIKVKKKGMIQKVKDYITM